MNAADVRACLSRRWADGEFITINEAPTDASRMGRKIDVLAVSLWASRGFELDAVEVKVSISDWKRELARGAKAEFWFRHSHRFWLAVPAALADKVREDLPSQWGLLSCSPDGPPKAVVKAATRTAEPLPWSAVIGLLRTASDAGYNALRRAEERGRQEGQRVAKALAAADAQRRSPDGAAAADLQRLKETVAGFERATGLRVADGPDAVAIRTARNRVEGVASQARRTVFAVQHLLASAQEAEAAAARVAAGMREAEAVQC
ncbi:MAG TPA: hypothetical protein VFJ16_08290 [Longimicrobium sp.]|nr:hypothetical protein [Longimicrobium sp.]